MTDSATFEVGSKRVVLSHPGKVLYPETGFSKRDVAEYYASIGPVMLPHIKGRPVTLKRYPGGVGRKSFWSKDCPKERPSWVRTSDVWAPSSRRTVHYCLLNNLPSLIWVANLAALELHASLARARDLTRPSVLVLDLDPGPPATILQCARVALRLRDLLAVHKLQCRPKTSGSKGLQLYVPLNSAVDFSHTKAFAHALAERLEAELPDLVTANMRREQREGKVLIDWSQNDTHKTTISVYSLRGKTSRPRVSTPVSWEEVQAAVDSHDADQLVFEAADVLGRVQQRGDLFEPVLTLRQRLPERFGAMASAR